MGSVEPSSTSDEKPVTQAKFSRPRSYSTSGTPFEDIHEESEESLDSPTNSKKTSLEEHEHPKHQNKSEEEDKEIVHDLTSNGASSNTNESVHKPILKHGSSLEVHTSLTKNSDEPEKPVDPVDNYYAKNYYTVTGAMGPNGENFRKLPIKPRYRRAVSEASYGKRSFHSLRPTVPGQAIAKREFHKSLYWLTFDSKRFGFRHLGFILIVLAYSFLGATFFYIVESQNERETIATRLANLEQTMVNLGSEIADLVNDPLRNTTGDNMKKIIKDAYVKLLNIEGAYRWTTYFKVEDPQKNYKWTWGSSLFFCMNVYTTTGYGSIAPETRFAQFIVMVYGFIFVPLTLVLMRSMGQLALVFFTKTYARTLIKLRQVRGYPDTKEDEIISLPLKLGLFIAFAYWFLISVFIYEYDRVSGPPGSGIDFFASVYFCFISLSTIGLGDVMPNNVQFEPIITTIFFLGIPLLKVVNRGLYLAIENGLFASFALMENKLAYCLAGQSVEPEAPARTEGRTRSVSTSQQEAQLPTEEMETASDWANNLTIRSIAQFMRSNSDVYGGGYGRVDLRRGDLLPSSNQNTVRSVRNIRPQSTNLGG